MQVGAINDRIDGRTEGGKGKETKDGKEASFADLKRRKRQTAVKEKYLLGMDAVRFLQGRQAVWDIFPIFSFGLLPPLFQNLSIRSLTAWIMTSPACGLRFFHLEPARENHLKI